MSVFSRFVNDNMLTVIVPTLFMILYNFLLSRKEPMWSMQPMNIVLPMLATALLSPGVILSVPPQDGSKILFSEFGSTPTQLAVHGVFMVLLLYQVRRTFPQYYSYSL